MGTPLSTDIGTHPSPAWEARTTDSEGTDSTTGNQWAWHLLDFLDPRRQCKHEVKRTNNIAFNPPGGFTMPFFLDKLGCMQSTQMLRVCTLHSKDSPILARSWNWSDCMRKISPQRSPPLTKIYYKMLKSFSWFNKAKGWILIVRVPSWTRSCPHADN